MRTRSSSRSILGLALLGTTALAATAAGSVAHADGLGPTIVATQDSVAADVLYVVGSNFTAGDKVMIQVHDTGTGTLLSTATVQADGTGGFAKGFSAGLSCAEGSVSVQATDTGTQAVSNSLSVAPQSAQALNQIQLSGAQSELQSQLTSPPATGADAATWDSYEQQVAQLELAIFTDSLGLGATQPAASATGACATSGV